jgi:hypothetical protein
MCRINKKENREFTTETISSSTLWIGSNALSNSAEGYGVSNVEYVLGAVALPTPPFNFTKPDSYFDSKAGVDIYLCIDTAVS